MSRGDWEKERQREENRDSEDRAGAGAGSGVSSGIVVKALLFPQPVTSRITSSLSKHQPETTLTDGLVLRAGTRVKSEYIAFC